MNSQKTPMILYDLLEKGGRVGRSAGFTHLLQRKVLLHQRHDFFRNLPRLHSTFTTNYSNPINSELNKWEKEGNIEDREQFIERDTCHPGTIDKHVTINQVYK